MLESLGKRERLGERRRFRRALESCGLGLLEASALRIHARVVRSGSA